MTAPIIKFARLERARRRLLMQAVYELYWARRQLARKPVRESLAGIEDHSAENTSGAVQVGDPVEAKNIGWAVRTASRITPWSNSCLVQVVAAQKIMCSRGIGGVIYVGTQLGEENKEGFKAHAWLKHGEAFVTGEAGHDQYQVLTTFTW